MSTEALATAAIAAGGIILAACGGGGPHLARAQTASPAAIHTSAAPAGPSSWWVLTFPANGRPRVFKATHTAATEARDSYVGGYPNVQYIATLHGPYPSKAAAEAALTSLKKAAAVKAEAAAALARRRAAAQARARRLAQSTPSATGCWTSSSASGSAESVIR